MNWNLQTVRSGYNKKECLVHARCCFAPHIAVMTAQYLNVDGCDLFAGIMMAKSLDGGNTWTDFEQQAKLSPVTVDDVTTVGCDATPMYHKATGKILLIGLTTRYALNKMHSSDNVTSTFYSVFDEQTQAFGPMKFLQMPEGFENCGNGCGQSFELENGELLIPVNYTPAGEKHCNSLVVRCDFDGETLSLLEIGDPITLAVERGVCEPSVIKFNNEFYLTLRNDECGLVAKSNDGLHYDNLHFWRWDDGSLLQNYNTQQHWMTVGNELYLVYTRRDDKNGHVFRHRAPLFAARVENMKLVRESEIVLVPERGARLGNFGVENRPDGTAVVTAAEWMQPKGCEIYGSDNAIFSVTVSK